MILHCHLYPARVSQLLTVNLSPDAKLQGRLQHAVCFFGREEALVAENIDEVSQVFLGNSGQHFVHNQVYIFCLSALIGTSNGMRTQERGNHSQGRRLLDSAYHPQHFQFVIGIKSVATLDLHGTRSLLNNLAYAFHRLPVEFVLRHLVQPVSRIQDAPATTGNLGIAQPLNLVNKLPFATARIDQMRM